MNSANQCPRAAGQKLSNPRIRKRKTTPNIQTSEASEFSVRKNICEGGKLKSHPVEPKSNRERGGKERQSMTPDIDIFWHPYVQPRSLGAKSHTLYFHHFALLYGPGIRP